MEKTLNVIEYYFKDNEARLEKETIRVYRIALTQFFTCVNKDYNYVKRTDVRLWYVDLAEKGLMPASIRNKLSAIKSFYNYLLEENLIEKHPSKQIESPKIDDSIPKYLDKRQLALLMEITKDNIRDRVIVELLYTTGARISELLNIKLSDIKWDSRQIWIRKGKGNKERFVLFTPECSERLKAYLEQNNINSGYIFPNKTNPDKHITRSNIGLVFQRYSNELGFKVTPHMLRHTFGAHLSEKGMPITMIQILMGHKNINSTRRYTRLNNKARKAQYDSLQ